jgi:hypothetical protein
MPVTLRLSRFCRGQADDEASIAIACGNARAALKRHDRSPDYFIFGSLSGTRNAKISALGKSAETRGNICVGRTCDKAQILKIGVGWAAVMFGR